MKSEQGARVLALPIGKPDGADLRALNASMEDVFERVWKLGGTITREYGDGMLRAPFVRDQYPETYEVMVEIKKIYDPRGLLNPGEIQVKN